MHERLNDGLRISICKQMPLPYCSPAGEPKKAVLLFFIASSREQNDIRP